MVLKSTPHCPRIGRKTLPNGPECSRDPPRRVSKLLPGPLRRSNSCVELFEATKGGTITSNFSLFDLFLGPGRDQKINKNRPCAQKGVPKDDARSNFCARAVFLSFLLPFEAKIRPKINENLKVLFWLCVRFFQTGESQILCTGAVF